MFSKKIFIPIFFFCVVFGLVVLWSMHEKVYSDQIVIANKDTNLLIILEAHRTSVLWIYYNHDYVMYTYSSWVPEEKKVHFQKFTPEISENTFITAFIEQNDYEKAEKRIYGALQIKNEEIKFSTEILHADFVTKTNPYYFRYISTGTGIIEDKNKRIPVNIFISSTIAHDGSYSRLKEWTHVNGHMGVLWDNGKILYFDASQILERWKGEDYTDHSYAFIKNNDGSIIRYDTSFFKLEDNRFILTVNGKSYFLDSPFALNSSSDKYYLININTFYGLINTWKY